MTRCAGQCDEWPRSSRPACSDSSATPNTRSRTSRETVDEIAGEESLWSTSKHEFYYRHVFRTKSELVVAVDNWMRFYNNERRHSSIGMRSPIVYEHTLKAAPEAR
jgi:transposase InsO family protein